ncbi:unnamed protein product [Candidula unifasciata]|uniref:Autophagy-related protein 13 n=1 Tax=Candidula unifasciata TaxID=100452 RepID=A0A8S3YJY3_9EUPU|nr:unnamed protein product [Candidula unifasciata]
MATSGLNSVFSFEGSGVKDDNVERLFKNFTYKCLQIVVQSRIDNQSVRSTRDSSTSDYFCISIPDNQCIEEHIRKTLDGVKSFPVRDRSLCTEIFLVTNDRDQMFLETWELSFNQKCLDMVANRIQHIFTRMSVTLKSLLSATRAMPAYRLARNKDGGYWLNYRFYMGTPQTHLLGDGYKTVRAGAVPTAFGLLSVSCSYRTKLLLSAEMSASATAAIEVTDNYFVNEYRPAAMVSDPKPCSLLNRSPLRSESPYCFAASPSSLENNDAEIGHRLTADGAPVLQNSIFSIPEFPEPIEGAFSAQQPSYHRSVAHGLPFEGLMKRSIVARQLVSAQCRDGESDVDGVLCHNRKTGKQQDEEEKENHLYSSVEIIADQKISVEDDFVMIDKPPFAADDDPRDAKSFLSAMYRAANLYELPDSSITVADYLSDVEALVFKLEEDMPSLDDFCQSVISAHSREEDDDIPVFS